MNMITGAVVEYRDDELTDKWLVENWFLIDKNLDQYTMAYTFDYLIRRQKLISEGWLTDSKGRGFVILTTTGCNASCPYCYEKGCSVKNMDEKTARDVVEYIDKYGKRDVDITWFGGEPLVNQKVINIITEGLKERNISFTSRITTNGYFLQNIDVYTLKYKWNVYSLQITIDSEGEEYEKIKGFEPGTYEKMLQTMKRLAEGGIKVRVRFNVTPYNAAGIHKAIDDIADLKIDPDMIGIYTAPVADESMKETDQELETKFQNLLDLDEHMEEVDMLEYKQLRDFSIHPFSCMADRWDCLVISPDGLISCCEHMIDGGIGDIWNGITHPELFDEWKIKREPQDICKDCKCMTMCMKLKNCKGYVPCNVYEKNWWEQRVVMFLRRLCEKED